MSTHDPGRFVIDGRIITQWDPCPGVLKLGEYTLWVMPGVAVADLAIGMRVTAAGHQDVGTRCVITKLMLRH
jgi:hypothetical protein